MIEDWVIILIMTMGIFGAAGLGYAIGWTSGWSDAWEEIINRKS